MSLYGRIEEVAVRDFEFLRMLSKDSLDRVVSNVERTVMDFEGVDAKEGFIYQTLMEEVAHLLNKGLLLQQIDSPDWLANKR